MLTRFESWRLQTHLQWDTCTVQLVLKMYCFVMCGESLPFKWIYFRWRHCGRQQLRATSPFPTVAIYNPWLIFRIYHAFSPQASYFISWPIKCLLISMFVYFFHILFFCLIPFLFRRQHSSQSFTKFFCWHTEWNFLFIQSFSL